ncbi:hypothetical protein HO173_010489 [Letharia columbiana]|uniref:PUM-HD domain-containing protein n=1 Tax=Letharia columbiana TaxID=112416 RepID=A0A8H6L0V4_9LECA|nr:uncharacterized protein HO173_010489 [Letharia columbiana]KAF6231346.1 hypothetical protein HO173_010489 [Letharia columbiana]
MAGLPSNGSPAARGRVSTTQFAVHDETDHQDNSMSSRQASSTSKQGVSKHGITTNEGPMPLSTSKLGNLQPTPGPSSGSKKMKVEHSAAALHDEMQPDSMDSLLAKLSEQQALLAKQKTTLPTKGDIESHTKEGSTASSALLTPASESFSYTNTANAANDEDDKLRIEASEMARLKKELDDAKDQIARQKHELDQTRVIKHTFDQAMGPPSEVALSPRTDVTDPTNAFMTSNRPLGTVQGHWGHEDARSDGSDVVGPFNAVANAWSNPSRPSFNAALQPDSGWGQPGPRSWGQRAMGNALPPPVLVSQQTPMQQRNYSVPVSPVSGGGGRGMNDFGQFNQARSYGQMNPRDNRNAPSYQRGNGWDVYTGGPGPMDGMNLGSMSPSSTYQPLNMYPSAYQPRPIGTPLSPTAAEFRAGQASANPWNSAPPASPGQTYVSPMEPLNYRRLLDRSVTCNWKYIVDKIVCNNDQQASIFLQQKLKVGTVEQKYEIIEAIVAQAYPLMVNRFGNFLVQRCFEHGTPEQVIAIANAIRGNTLSLSMDAFGCHVVQKAFDAVPEEYKAIMVHELLRRIPETVIHRYACHVWQKLFELRWSDSPPQIMKYVNEALCGMWHEVALGETGSLVVQNIFENCLEEDKRPCINEVLSSIDIVAHGQFGNWCIQHICEHGLPADRSRAIDHVLRYATEYSMDQFASKVVEKCLKIGGVDFLERYLERVCEGRADRPRIPLIDIASDQYGNYLIQYILTHANPNHRDIVASHIRKHMVSLRGSKFGSRVGMLCCNPAYTTHPGPGAGLPTNRFSSAPSSIPRFGGAYR